MTSDAELRNIAHDEVTRLVRVPAAAPQIIRAPAELDNLDPDTLLRYSGVDGGYEHAANVYFDDLPAIVVCTGEHYRASREELEGGTHDA